jgi:hypothetical protein
VVECSVAAKEDGRGRVGDVERAIPGAAEVSGMQTEGVFAPATAAEARDRYGAVGPAAREVVRETAKAMSFDGDEYRERVTSSVVETARDAMFASLLRVHLGSRDAFDEWREQHPDAEVSAVGSENVDSVAWHHAPAANVVVAASFQNEPEAAASAVRRQAFGRVYREIVSE